MKKLFLAFVLLVLPGFVQAQSASGVTLELGHNGEIVAKHWNPLRLTLRDQGPAELLLRMGQGGLRNEEKVVTYRAELAGGSGIHVFEDEIYVPAWSSFSWSVIEGGRTLESGSFDPRFHLNGDPVHLVVSSNPGRWRDAYEAEVRLTEIAAGSLPERMAAYDGVASLLIDGTAAAPKLSAVAAATAAGVHTFIVTPLPSSHEDLLALTVNPVQPLGAGTLSRVSAGDLPRALAGLHRLEQQTLTEALKTRDLTAYPTRLPQLTLLIAASLYVLLCLLMVRFAGLPGLLASFALSAIFSLAAWQVLRPQASQFVRSRSLDLGGGDLAARLELQTVLSLPQRSLSMPLTARPLEPRSYAVTPQSLSLEMTRWSVVDLSARPSLQAAVLKWRGNELHNAGDSLLYDVYVKGLGSQSDLAADSSLLPVAGSEVGQALVYERLIPQLPVGSALARSGGNFYIALPPVNTREPL